MKKKMVGAGLLILEVALLFSLFSFVPTEVFAGIGNPTNVTTWLKIGNVYPDVIRVELNGGGDITLTPNQTTSISCVSIVRDYNGDADIADVNATLYHSSYLWNTPDDNNYHYTNSSCEWNADTGGYLALDDAFHSIANCTFQVEYYANPGTWECNVTATDSVGWTGDNQTTETVNELLALGTPDTINYTEVNATDVSDEKVANVTNLGNVQINLTLQGWGAVEGDGHAMECDLGNIGYIPVMYEKYNLSESTAVVNSLSEFEATYTNLTSTPVTRTFNLDSRTNDTVNKAINSTYWRIYVPKGVAGTCNGTIEFGATNT